MKFYNEKVVDNLDGGVGGWVAHSIYPTLK